MITAASPLVGVISDVIWLHLAMITAAFPLVSVISGVIWLHLAIITAAVIAAAVQL